MASIRYPYPAWTGYLKMGIASSRASQRYDFGLVSTSTGTGTTPTLLVDVGGVAVDPLNPTYAVPLR